MKMVLRGLVREQAQSMDRAESQRKCKETVATDTVPALLQYSGCILKPIELVLVRIVQQTQDSHRDYQQIHADQGPDCLDSQAEK